MNVGETKPFDGDLEVGSLSHEALMSDIGLVVARTFVSLIWI